MQSLMKHLLVIIASTLAFVGLGILILRLCDSPDTSDWLKQDRGFWGHTGMASLYFILFIDLVLASAAVIGSLIALIVSLIGKAWLKVISAMVLGLGAAAEWWYLMECGY